MRLVLREYLSMLKESGELDALLPDLLIAMELEPLSRPTRGTRQNGVDLSAVGVDPEDHTRKLFLFLVKQGDITRSNWDSGPQAVYQSLNDVFYIYLRTQVSAEHQDLPKKVILTTSGEIRENSKPHWDGYVHEHSGTHQKYGEIQFSFWGADKLSLLLDQYLLDEYLFPESARKQVRKTIALADQNEEDPRFFYELIEDTLFHRNLRMGGTVGAQRRRRQALRLINLSVNIVFHWCQEADNLRPALLCSERAILRVWDWMRQGEFFDEATQRELARLFGTYLNVALAYAAKVVPVCFVRDGLFGFGADELEYPIRTFEVVGILGELAMALRFIASGMAQEQKASEKYNNEGQKVAQMLAALIRHNPSAFSPCFDGHGIDIGLGLLALVTYDAREPASGWLTQLSDRVLFAYRIGQHIPIPSDSYDDLVDLWFGEEVPKEQLTRFSTLVPLLADWFAVLDLRDRYEAFQLGVAGILPKTDLQMWFPSEDTEESLYRANAAAQGKTHYSIRLPDQLDGLKERIARLMKQSAFDSLSYVKQGWPILGLIASRHFRTPLMPEYWQKMVRSEDHRQEDQVSAVPTEPLRDLV